MKASMKAAGRASSGASVPNESGGQVIISLLQVVESDLAKHLAEVQEEEGTAQDEYEKLLQQNKVATTRKQQDVKYKTASILDLQKTISEKTADRATVQQELDAVNQYYEELKPQSTVQQELDAVNQYYEELK